tara:strand:+ start:2122 stop:2370 length:249 start_codon:yes stop_codon:yes gene_type:complete
MTKELTQKKFDIYFILGRCLPDILKSPSTPVEYVVDYIKTVVKHTIRKTEIRCAIRHFDGREYYDIVNGNIIPKNITEDAEG